MNMMGLTIHKIMSENKVVLAGRKTKSVELPESKAVVEVYASPRVIDLQDFAKLDKDSNDIVGVIKAIIGLIKSWNIYISEEDNDPRVIDEKSVGDLSVNDLTHLVKEISAFMVEEKKE